MKLRSGIKLFLDTKKETAAMYFVAEIDCESFVGTRIFTHKECGNIIDEVDSIPETAVEFSEAISGNFAYERIAVLASGRFISVRYAAEWLRDGIKDEINYTHWYYKNIIEKCLASVYERIDECSHR